MKATDLRVGATYRGKRIRRNVFQEPNDRRILWKGSHMYRGDYCDCVQYDSWTVSNGRTYPFTSVEAFLKWAKHEVVESSE